MTVAMGPFSVVAVITYSMFSLPWRDAGSLAIGGCRLLPCGHRAFFRLQFLRLERRGLPTPTQFHGHWASVAARMTIGFPAGEGTPLHRLSLDAGMSGQHGPAMLATSSSRPWAWRSLGVGFQYEPVQPLRRLVAWVSSWNSCCSSPHSGFSAPDRAPTDARSGYLMGDAVGAGDDRGSHDGVVAGPAWRQEFPDPAVLCLENVEDGVGLG